MTANDKAAGRALLDASLKGDELAYAKLHDLMLDLDYDADLAAAMIDIVRSMRTPGRVRYYDTEQYERAKRLGISEPATIAIVDEESRLDFIRWELDAAANGEATGAGHLGWMPAGPVIADNSPPEDGRYGWWLERSDLERLLNCEQVYHPVTLPKLPEGMFWAVACQLYLFIAKPFTLSPDFQGIAPPTKYIEFAHA
jgi:hypothetical protein